ncbi:MAG: hypothetical protein RR653_13210, partial [Clostridia bacterium]
TMAEDARNMQQASASIAKQMQALCEDMQTLHRQRAQTFGAVENTSTTLSKQIEDLTASLANMQQAVDILTAELDDQQGETQPHQADYLQELDAHY